ncbi:metaxin 3 [Turdus rufiventris]|nr:metaxin 3 [Turdus rufiventris]
MAAPMELSCWGGDWGLPSLHPESLTVMAYAKFSGAPLTVNTINNLWRAPKGLLDSLVSHQIYRDAKECLNLLSKRLGTSQFFFGDTPTTLDAFVFGFLAPIYKVCFPRVQLQEHLKQLPNLCRFCDDILTCYFRLTVSDPALIVSLQMDDNLRKSPQHPPRKLTTLKLAAGGEESSPMSRLSP